MPTPPRSTKGGDKLDQLVVTLAAFLILYLVAYGGSF